MAYIIIDRDGELLRDIDGNMLVCPNAGEAARFVMVGERVEKLAPDDPDNLSAAFA